MTATAPIPAAEAPPMANTPDNRPDQPTAEAPPAPAAAPAGTEAKPRSWAILADNPLLTILGIILTLMGSALIGALFLVLNDHSRDIDRLEDSIAALDTKMDRRFAEQDAKFEAKFDELDSKIAALEAKFDELDSKISELDRKLTALIAALHRTDAVDAAMEGRPPESAPVAPG